MLLSARGTVEHSLPKRATWGFPFLCHLCSTGLMYGSIGSGPGKDFISTSQWVPLLGPCARLFHWAVLERGWLVGSRIWKIFMQLDWAANYIKVARRLGEGLHNLFKGRQALRSWGSPGKDDSLTLWNNMDPSQLYIHVKNTLYHHCSLKPVQVNCRRQVALTGLGEQRLDYKIKI